MMRRPSLRRFFFIAVALFGAISNGTADSAEDRITAIEARMGGRIGLAALDSGSGRRLLHRSDERFPMCSTFKFLAAAAVLHRVDEKQDQLTRFVPYTAADLLEYAPVTKQHVYEGGMTLGALCDAALTLSDNTAGNLLLNAIGGPEGLTRYARSLGDQKTRLDRMEPELNSALPGDERDTTTPAAMLGNLRALLLADALSAASRQQLETWLAHNQTGTAMIHAGLPADWKIGDKTGRGGNGATNDIAILRPPGRAPILLTVYSVGSAAPSAERLAAVAEVAKVVAERFQK
ncbi:MAG TPA: class A beta-lactamase [Chthoniobacterales bacterium]|nr:class A beta-lactamase [Chthoniobacterales bacterium]